MAAEFGVRLKLSEELREAQRSVGLDLAIFNGDDTWTLPHPSRFVIGADGVVRHVSTYEDVMDRPSAESTLAALEALG